MTKLKIHNIFIFIKNWKTITQKFKKEIMLYWDTLFTFLSYKLYKVSKTVIEKFLT